MKDLEDGLRVKIGDCTDDTDTEMVLHMMNDCARGRLENAKALPGPCPAFRHVAGVLERHGALGGP